VIFYNGPVCWLKRAPTQRSTAMYGGRRGATLCFACRAAGHEEHALKAAVL
jgi:hypothetical protein